MDNPKCAFCKPDQTFRHEDALRVHYLHNHFICNVCEGTSPPMTKAQRDDHIMWKHIPKILGCPHCDSSQFFMTVFAYKLHITRTHTTCLWCNFCGIPRTFPSTTALHRHTQSVHNQNDDGVPRGTSASELEHVREWHDEFVKWQYAFRPAPQQRYQTRYNFLFEDEYERYTAPPPSGPSPMDRYTHTFYHPKKGSQPKPAPPQPSPPAPPPPPPQEAAPIDIYSILRISPQSSHLEASRAAKQRRIDVHPDRLKNREGLSKADEDTIDEVAKMVGCAAEIVLDPARRRKHDGEMREWKGGYGWVVEFD